MLSVRRQLERRHSTEKGALPMLWAWRQLETRHITEEGGKETERGTKGGHKRGTTHAVSSKTTREKGFY